MSISLKNIAQIAGVSKTTVSFIINDKHIQHRISPKTVEKVMSVVREQGFQPNELARGLRLKNIQTIGLVVGDVTNPFLAQMGNSIGHEAKLAGYNLIIASSGERKEVEEEVVGALLRRSVNGLIINSVFEDDSTHRKLNKNTTPVVYIDHRMEGSDSVSIVSNNRDSVCNLISHWIRQGKSNFAFIGGDPVIQTNKARLTGFLSALKKQDIPSSQYRIYSGRFSPESGYESMKELAQSGFQPDAVFTASLGLLEGALSYIEENQSFESGKIKFGTFDNHPLLNMARIRVDAIEQDCATMGKEAFASLLTMIDGVKAKKVKTIPTRFIPRD